MNLAGKRVVLTRQAGKNERLGTILRERGAETIEVPVIEVIDPPGWDVVDASIERLSAGDFEWVIFTSGNAVTRYCARLGSMSDEVFAQTKVAAVGSTTARLLKEEGVTVDLVPESYTGASVARALGAGTGSVLLPRAEEVPVEMTEVLEQYGWAAEHVTVYRTVTSDGSAPGAERVRAGDFDVVTFTSASTVRGFIELFGPPETLGLQPVANGTRRVACIGPVTARACADRGFRVDTQAEPHTIEGLADALSGLPDDPSVAEVAR